MALILVVEDDIVSQTLVCSVCENMGHTPIVCGNGQLAMDILELNHKRFKLVISDIMMPKKDGHALLRELRTDEHMYSIPIIIQSAYLGVQATSEMIEQGAAAVLHKPLDAELLREYIEANLPN